MARDLTTPSTEELLKRAAEPWNEVQFADAVGALVMRYKSLVYSQALAVCSGNLSLADDVFQETFLRLFTWLKQRKSGPPLHSFARLLHVFSKRAAIDLMRKSSVLSEELEPNLGVRDRWEERLYLEELLEQLDDRSQQVLQLTYFEGLTAPQIAKKLNLKAENVRILRFRALQALRERQERDRIADLVEEV